MNGKNRYILDISLLEKFKQAVSDYDDFLINTYSHYKGKNLWSLICSAKDWLCQCKWITIHQHEPLS